MAETPDGTNGNGNIVRVTLKDVYATVQEIQRSVEVLHADMRVHVSLPAHPTSTPVIADHEARLRVVERWKYAIPASLVIIAAAVLETLVRHGG